MNAHGNNISLIVAPSAIWSALRFISTPLLVGLFCFLFVVSGAASAEGVGFRMGGDGRFEGASAPLNWSSEEGIVWKAAMPAWSNASPLLLGEAGIVVVTSEPDVTLALDADSGKVRWQDALTGLASKRPKAHDDNGWATPTPASDGEHVFVAFGFGGVAAYDLEGQRKWARMVQKPAHRWGHSASPVLGGGVLIVQFVDLFGLDPVSGKELWRVESEPRWGSPVVTTIGGQDVVITPSGDVFRATDGTRVAAGIGSLRYATPLVQDGHAYFIEKKATAVKLPDTLEGAFETIWLSQVEGSRHYASPVLHDGLLYAVSREQEFSILDAASGEVVHTRTLDLEDKTNSAYPSLAFAGGKIYLGTENGTMVVLEPGREYRELARNRIEGFRSSPVFSESGMYLRGFEFLCRIGAAGE